MCKQLIKASEYPTLHRPLYSYVYIYHTVPLALQYHCYHLEEAQSYVPCRVYVRTYTCTRQHAITPKQGNMHPVPCIKCYLCLCNPMRTAKPGRKHTELHKSKSPSSNATVSSSTVLLALLQSYRLFAQPKQH